MSTTPEGPEQKDLVDTVFDALHAGDGAPDFENPPVLTDEVKRLRAIATVAKKGIIDRATAYIQTPAAERESKKHLLIEIQQIVDELDDPFVLIVPQKDGVPYSITFNPTSHKVETMAEPAPADVPVRDPMNDPEA